MLMLAQVVWSIGLFAVICFAAHDDAELLIKRLQAVTEAELHVYKLKDDRGRGMDCLKFFQPAVAPEAGVYYGVYHNYQQGVLVSHLARSTDFVTWTHLVELDKNASQPAIHSCDNGGFLVVYEHDEPNSVWIRIRYYEDLTALIAGKFQRQFDTPRTLAPTAEGTPSFEVVRVGNKGIESSEIKLRFHYYWNMDVDQLASGKLTNFESWEAEPARELNSAMREQGWNGNLGDRDKFLWKDQTYYLQEIQRTKGDWSSWRLGLCDEHGRLLQPLKIQTHHGSTAISNPHITWVRDSNEQKKLVVTLFLHSNGNPPEERGVLLYVIDPDEKSEPQPQDFDKSIKEQRTKNKEQRTKNKEQRTKN
jgi:hypothetical protein